MKLKKAMIVFGTVCIFSTMITGCGSGSESAAKTEEIQISEVLSEDSNSASKEIDEDTEEPQENAESRWQVLEPDAAAVDADFLGKVWKIEEDSFFIAEKKVKILDDGSLSYSSPSSNADLLDTQLIHVVFEEDTRFYLKDTDENEEGHGNIEAGFQDLKEHMSVEMKGSFKNDEFHATEIRFF